jgi:hypothetical protein
MVSSQSPTGRRAGTRIGRGGMALLSPAASVVGAVISGNGDGVRWGRDPE